MWTTSDATYTGQASLAKIHTVHTLNALHHNLHCTHTCMDCNHHGLWALLHSRSGPWGTANSNIGAMWPNGLQQLSWKAFLFLSPVHITPLCSLMILRCNWSSCRITSRVLWRRHVNKTWIMQGLHKELIELGVPHWSYWASGSSNIFMDKWWCRPQKRWGRFWLPPAWITVT